MSFKRANYDVMDNKSAVGLSVERTRGNGKMVVNYSTIDGEEEEMPAMAQIAFKEKSTDDWALTCNLSFSFFSTRHGHRWGELHRRNRRRCLQTRGKGNIRCCFGLVSALVIPPPLLSVPL